MKIQVDNLSNRKTDEVYFYYLRQLKKMKDSFLELGHTSGFVDAITAKYENECSEIMWIEENSTIKGVLVFGEKVDISRRMITLFFLKADDNNDKLLFSEFEKLAKNRGYLKILFLTSVKDEKTISSFEDMGLRKEYFHLFKKISELNYD